MIVKWMVRVVLTGLAGLWVTGCGKASAPPPPLPQVTVAQPVRQKVTNTVEFTGTLAAVNSVDLRARVRGFLREVKFKDGQEVKKGTVLFVIEQAPYKAAVEQAQAELAQAQASATQAKEVYERYKTSFDQKVATETELIDARAKRDESKARVEAAKASLKTAQINLGYTTVKAPLDGRIGRRLVDAGNLVGDGQATLLAKIVQVDPVYIYFYVSEKVLLDYINRHGHTADVAEPGQEAVPARLGLGDEKGFPHKGMIDYADNTVDPSTGTIQLRGEFPNPGKDLVPGLFARVRIAVGEPASALLIPQRAISRSQRGSFVYVLNDDQTVRQQVVTLGRKVGSLRVVETGLKDHDKVVVEGLLRIRPGVKVLAQPASPPTATSGPASRPVPDPGQGG